MNTNNEPGRAPRTRKQFVHGFLPFRRKFGGFLGVIGLAAACWSGSTAQAQPAHFQWAQLLSETGNQPLAGILDAQGNSVVASMKYLYSSDGRISTLSWASNTVVKLDQQGDFLWQHQILPSVKAMAADAAGNVFVGGSLLRAPGFSLPANYLSTVGITAEGEGSAYVAKLKPDGALEWFRRIGESAGIETTAIALDPEGNYYAAGYYTSSPARIGNFPLPAMAASARHLFLAKFDSQGIAEWVRAGIGGSQFATVYDLKQDAAGHIFLLGHPSDRSYSFEEGHTTGEGSFVLKYDASGKLLWTLNPGKKWDFFMSFAVDQEGNSFFAYNPSTATHGPSAPPMVIKKFSPEAELLWSREPAIGSADREIIAPTFFLAVNPLGECFVIGTVAGDTSTRAVLPGEIHFGDDVRAISTALSDVYVAKYSSSGEAQWVVQSDGLEPRWIGDAPSRFSDTRPAFAAVDPTGSILIGGSLKGTVNFGETQLVGPGVGLINDFGSGGPVVFAARIADPQKPALRLQVVREGAAIHLAWADLEDVVVESTSNLEPATWSQVPAIPVRKDGHYTVTIETANSQSFFRLRRP